MILKSHVTRTWDDGSVDHETVEHVWPNHTAKEGRAEYRRRGWPTGMTRTRNVTVSGTSWTEVETITFTDFEDAA